MQRILGCKYYMYRIKITYDSTFSLCTKKAETMVHLFSYCRASHNLWQNIQIWIHNKLKLQIEFSNENIILGYLNWNANHTPLNSLILIAKAFLFWCSRHNQCPNIVKYQERAESLYNMHLQVALWNFKEDEFNKHTNKWGTLFYL